jgi:hypothetical protein
LTRRELVNIIPAVYREVVMTIITQVWSSLEVVAKLQEDTSRRLFIPIRINRWPHKIEKNGVQFSIPPPR